MRDFKEADVVSGRIYVDQTELVDVPLSWQVRGLQQTASGYGSKLTTRHKISFNGKLYRLYCTCYSNAGTVWFKTGGRRIIVS